MNKKIKIVYCLPSLYIPGGMERVLTIKANYFAEKLGYDIYIIINDIRCTILFGSRIINIQRLFKQGVEAFGGFIPISYKVYWVIYGF